MLLVVLLALHVQIGIHELGHLLAVYACRYRPRRIGVGFLEFGPAGSRWRVRATREWRFFLGGVVMFTVPDHIRSWSRDVLCYSAGLFASLLVLVALAHSLLMANTRLRRSASSS